MQNFGFKSLENFFIVWNGLITVQSIQRLAVFIDRMEIVFRNVQPVWTIIELHSTWSVSNYLLILYIKGKALISFASSSYCFLIFFLFLVLSLTFVLLAHSWQHFILPSFICSSLSIFIGSYFTFSSFPFFNFLLLFLFLVSFLFSSFLFLHFYSFSFSFFFSFFLLSLSFLFTFLFLFLFFYF